MSVRVQIDFTDEEWKEFERYIPDYKLRHSKAKEALNEWRNRKEGRDKKFRLEKLLSDKKLLLPILQDMIDNGELRL
jgi:hypothetical protein